VAELPAHLTGAPLGEEAVSREVLEAHQRERVLERVAAVFAKRGYGSTTVDDLLASGNVGVTNFYALFEGKEDCFLAAFDRIVSGARERTVAAAAEDGDWAEETYLGLQALIEAILASPLEARLALIEAQSAGREALSRYNDLLDEAISWLRQGRDHFAAARELPPGFEQTSVSGFAFYLQQCLLDSRRHSTEELTREAAGSLLEPIVGAATLRRLANAAKPAAS
jgi:AcrR family transcriptional regulator